MKFFATSHLSEHIKETPEGYLVCLDVPIARTGEMVYAAGETPIQPDSQGKVIVTRDAAEVFRPETIASFQGKSFTIYHPDGFVDPKNWKTLTCGVIQNVRRGTGANENDLMADILITDSEAISRVKSGVREVSCGYDAEYIETGIGRGVQKGIIGNHVALVDEGRAGQAYAINDHAPKGEQGKGFKMSIIDKLKALVSEAEAKPEKVQTKDDKGAYDKMCAMMKDMGALLESMKPADASTLPIQAAPAEVKAKDEEKPVEVKAKDEEAEKKAKEEKQAARDAWIDAMMEKEAKEKAAADADPDKEEKKEEKESEESEDEDYEEGEGGEVGSEDDLEEVESMVGDDASRIEILAPGLKVKGKDARAKALEACYQTTDGKKLIELFTGGKAFDTKNAVIVDAAFIGVSELLKGERKKAFAASKTFDIQKSSLGVPKEGAMSAEDINKKMEAYYKAK